MTARNNQLLRDDDIRRFIAEGYVQVNAGLPAEFHRDLYRKIETVLEEEGNPGNNILPGFPRSSGSSTSPPYAARSPACSDPDISCIPTGTAT